MTLLMALLAATLIGLGIRYLFFPPTDDNTLTRLHGWLRLTGGLFIGFGLFDPFVGYLACVVMAVLLLLVFVIQLAIRRSRRMLVTIALAGVAAWTGFNHVPEIADRLIVYIVQPDPAPDEFVPSRDVVSFDDVDKTLVESVLAHSDGSLYVTLGDRGEIRRIRPAGTWEILVTIPKGEFGVKRFTGVISTLTEGPDGEIYVGVVTLDPARNGIWRVSTGGSAELFVQLPAGAQPNGTTLGPDDKLYVADSHLATVWQIDLEDASYSAWLEHPTLGRQVNWAAPGANGIKFFGDYVYVSNSFQAHVVRARVDPDGTLSGEPQVWATGIPSDDFAFDIEGNMYITTHPYNTVVRIAPDGGRAVIGGVAQGVAGPTDVAFGVNADDRSVLYVANDGGFVVPVPGLGPGIVALDVGVPGQPLL